MEKPDHARAQSFPAMSGSGRSPSSCPGVPAPEPDLFSDSPIEAAGRPPAFAQADSDLGWAAPLSALRSVGLYALVVLLLSTQPFFEYLWYQPGWRLTTGTMWGSAFAVGVTLAVRIDRFAWLMSSFRGLPFLWLALLLLVLSCIWSLDPTWSLYRALWVVGTTMVGVALGYLLNPRQLMRVLLWFFTGILLGSFTIEVLALADGPHRWVGTTPNSNLLGPITASAATYFLIAMLYRRLRAQVAVPLCLLAVFITIMTQSATSIVMLLIGVAVVASFRFGRLLRLGGDLAAVLIVLGLVGLGAVGLVNWEGTTSILGKDVTATNRVQAWNDATHIIADRPLSGFGLGVVWGLGKRTYFPEFRSTRSMSHAHNGYLHLAAEAGLPAVALALIYLIRALVRAIADFAR